MIAASVENRMAVSQQIKNRITLRSSNPTSGLHPKEMKTGSSSYLYTPHVY